jgi:glycine/D-amino acid oxidase-like deaminating enzyme
MAQSDEDARNWQLIRTPLGEEWSGRTRYAAAMYLYRKGEMSAEVLEVYRTCSRLDAEDPLAIVRERRIGAEWLNKIEEDGRSVTEKSR